MNRLARASGIAVSSLTAATATTMLLLPGPARLGYPEVTAAASGGGMASNLSGLSRTGGGSAAPSPAGDPGALPRLRPGVAGGALDARRPLSECSGVPPTSTNYDAIGYGTVSGRCPNEVLPDSDCPSC
jgi:hypothetical protein